MADFKRSIKGHSIQDLTDSVHGPFTVTGIDEEKTKPGRIFWLCKCLCGRERSIRSDHFKRCEVYSQCTCRPFTRHGLSHKREFRIYEKMLARCYRKENDNYRFYGAIGHYVCQRWRESAEAFLSDVGDAPSIKHTLDRINTHGSYTCGKCDECREKGQPANCRWATKTEQSHNMKNNLWFTHDGRTLILKDWAREFSMPYLRLYRRVIIAGWDFERAVSEPPRPIKARRSIAETPIPNLENA